MNVITAYDISPVVPMTAPVIRFSLRAPNAPVIIMMREVIEIETKIAKRIPIIIIEIRDRLLYTFCFVC